METIVSVCLSIMESVMFIMLAAAGLIVIAACIWVTLLLAGEIVKTWKELRK